MDKKIAKVIGKSLKGYEVEFDLSFKEVKHIRRCCLFYLRIHPELNERKLNKNLSNKIYEKFDRFGKGKRRLCSNQIKKKLKNVPKICSIEGCEEKVGLIVDHIRPLSAGGSNRKDNLRYLCKRHNEIREIKYILKRKEAEVLKLKERLKQLEG